MLAIGIVLSAAAAYLATRQIEHEARLKFEGAVSDSPEAIEARIRAYSDILLGIRGMYIADSSVSRREFRSYINSLDLNRRYPGVQVIHYSQRIPAAQKQAFEERVRNDTSVDPRGYPDFAIKPAGERPEYVVVQYVEPMAGNEAALGLDLGGDAVRLAALERTRDSGLLTASGTIALAHDPRKHPGFAMRLPIYHRDMPLDTVAQRREAFAGMVSASFVVIDLMRGVFGEQFLQKVRVRIHDAGFLGGPAGLQPPSRENLMFDSDRLLGAPSPQDEPSDRGVSGLTRTAELDVGGRRWKLFFSAREGFVEPSERWLPMAVLLGGGIIALLLFGLIRSLATSGSRALELANRITEDLRKSEANLAEAQRMTEQLIEVLPNPVFFKDTDGRYIGVNKAWERYFGIPRTAFIGKTVFDLYPDHREVASKLDAMDQVLWRSPGTQVYETSIMTPDGRRHETIYCKATFTRPDGSVAGLIGTIVDITERKEAEVRYRATFESAPVGIMHTAIEDDRILHANPKLCAMLGYTQEELLGMTTDQILSPDYRGADRPIYREKMLNGELSSFSSERKFLRKDGSSLWVNRTVSLGKDATGVPLYFIRIIEDISERKAAAERYRATFDNAPVGIMHVDLDRRILHVNPKLCEILGYTQEELIRKSVDDVIHPDFRDTDRRTYTADMLSGKVQSFASERLYLRKDGAPVWVNRTISLVRDAAGQPLYYVRIIEDITERKETEQRYRAIFDNAAVGITRVDLNGVLTDANQRFFDMLGYTKEELIGRSIKDFTHPDDYGQGVQFRTQLSRGSMKSAGGEKRFIHKNGKVVWARRTISTVSDKSGKPEYLISVVEDITDRKQTENRQGMEHAVTRVLAEAQTLSEAIPRIIQTICETMGWHCGARWQMDKQAGLLRCRETWGIDTPEIREFIAASKDRSVEPEPVGQGLVRRTYAAGQPVWIDDIARDQAFKRRALAARADLHGAFGFPLLGGNEVLGVMEFFHRDVREPDEMLIQIAQSIGSQIGQYMVRMQAEEAVKFVATHDALTGLPNRVMFNERLNHVIAQAQRYGRRLAILFIDLDRFKIINDTLGHESGDVLLREVATRLTDNLRATDTVARLGGDEFVVLVEEVSDPLDLAGVAHKLIAALGAGFPLFGQEYHVTASIGVSTYPDDGEDIQTLLKNADIAMYRAKEQGRNSFQFYSAQMNVHSVERLTLESGLRRALERDEIMLHYQPQVDIRRGHVTGMEALARWRHPELGLIPPASFIQIAEETGLIVPIGEWVLRSACEAQRNWQALGIPLIRVAVNLSPRQFVHGDLLKEVMRALERTGCEASCLELEITESMVMHNPERAVALINQLKEMGVRVAIDDFGTGYSSLAYLKRFPIDSLKIDRSFILDIPGDPGDAAITQAVIAMAHSLGLKVIAEGVETRDQFDFLRKHRCDEMQGYYFSAPLPEEQAIALLKQVRVSNA
ncbi:MAG: PAS domain S-box protein [Betaproteobacteria bacterium]|nr:PAS domain S-box protein [Betaproteobacteria bacterium]